jgi:NADH-quinone oxidoreductase subunit E
VSLRRLHHEQPESFAFTPANMEYVEAQIAKFPEGRQASAVIPVLWRAQEQEGWVTRPMIEEVARILAMEPIRVLEVATFYFMFHLHPVGSVAHVQVCGTTSCMLCGAEDLVEVCRERIADTPFQISADGKFSWEEVECLGACSNAPMAQIGKDYYEDLDRESFAAILDALARGEVPRPGSQAGRWASEPASGFTTLAGEPEHAANRSVEIALGAGDTVKRIDGSEPTARAIDLAHVERTPPPGPAPAEEAAAFADAPRTGPDEAEGGARPPGSDLSAEGGAAPVSTAAEPVEADRPALLDAPRAGGADDLKRIRGVGPALEALLHELGVYHFDQIAAWSDREVAWVDHHLEGFNGRIVRDEWVAQAKAILAEDKGDA